MKKLISLCLLLICLAASTTAFASDGGGIAGIREFALYDKVTKLYDHANGREISPLMEISGSYYYFLGKTPADAARVKLDVTDWGYVDKITVESAPFLTSSLDSVDHFVAAVISAEEALGLTENEITVLSENLQKINDGNDTIASVWSSHLKKTIYEKTIYPGKATAIIYTD